MSINTAGAIWLGAALVAMAAGGSASATAQTHDAHAANAHAQAAGRPGNPKKVARTVVVVMTDDMKFTPAKIDVKRGETIRFVAKNAGRLKHEMVMGSMTELKAHAEMMRKMPGMEHADPNQVSVDPGKSGNLVWQFTSSGVFDFACLEPGHLETGMQGQVLVK